VVKDDLSLTLFRNRNTRKIIEKFYEDLCGSGYISGIILKYADMYGVPPSLAFAVCSTESGFNVNAQNINQDMSIDRGLFQLNSKSFPYLNEDDFFSVETNVLFGIRHLKSCLKRGQNEIVALSIYNAGENRVTTDGAPLITLNYVSRVLDYKDNVERKLKALARDMLSS
jgi:soluble lytic murein transglycosylase-like protein